VRNLHVSEQKRLDVVLGIAKGMSVVKALLAAGYSVTTANHKPIMSGKKYMETVRTYAATIAEQIGREPIAAELELVENAERCTNEVVEALRRIHGAYSEMKTSDEKASNGEGVQTPVVARKKRGRKFDALMARANLAERIVSSQSPKFQEQVQELLKRGQAIDGEHLGYLGMALLEKDLVHPPKDPRTRGQIARTALEAGGKIGAAAAELHLHQHNHATLPPVVQRMLQEKMLELAGLQPAPMLPADVVNAPPPPLPGDTWRAPTPESIEKETEDLLRKQAASQPVATTLAKLQENARRGGQVVAAENGRRLAEVYGVGQK
jgi:hypothetical protein